MILTALDAADWLREPGLAENDSFQTIVNLVNEVVAEEWKWATPTIPARLRLLAMNAVARAWNRTPGKGALESFTRAVDDASRTERFSSTGSVGLDGLLADEELAYLHGSATGRTRTIGVGLSW